MSHLHDSCQHDCNSKLVELLVLLMSLLKWAILAIIAGALSGAGITLFLKLLHIGIEVGEGISLWWLALPIGGLVSAALIHYVSPESYGHGTEAVIRSVNEDDGEMPLLVAPIKAIATVISISVGASAGKEGPSAQIGAALSSSFGKLVRLDSEDRRRLTACGLAAGFSVITGAPIAGAVFATEALKMGSTFYGGLVPAMLASYTSVITARILGWNHPLIANITAPTLDAALLWQIAVCAVALGLIAWLYIEGEELAAHAFHRIPVSPPMRTFIGGIVLVLLALVFSRAYLGLGVEMYEGPLEGESIATWAFAIKLLFVAVTLGSGFSGGAMTPIFAIGAAAGSTLGRLFGFDPAFSAALGIVGFLAASANAPLTATVLGLEAFGSGFGAYGFAAALIAYVVVGHRSINATQHLGLPKSTEFEVDSGEQCGEQGHVRLAPEALRRYARVFPSASASRRYEGRSSSGSKGR